MLSKFIITAALLGVLLFFLGCAENPQNRKRKLEERIHEDLEYIVAEVLARNGKSLLLEQPYAFVVEYKDFPKDSAGIIQSYAHVHFKYFSDLGIFQSRKYRYWTKRKTWDRFENRLLHQ
jgi:hypothetical protein